MKYKVGDRVKIKSLDWYNENKDEFGNVVFSSKVPHFSWCENVRTVFTKDMAKFCGKVVTIESVWTVNYSIVEGTYRDYFTDEMIECKVEEEFKPKFKVGDRIYSKYHKPSNDLEIIQMSVRGSNCGYRVKNLQTNGTYIMWEYEMCDYKLVEEKAKPKMVNLEDVCEWVEKHIFDFPWYDNEQGDFSSKDIANALRKAMEE